MSLAKYKKLMESRDNIQKSIIQERKSLESLEKLRKLEEANLMNIVKTLEKGIAYETMGRDVCVCVEKGITKCATLSRRCEGNLMPAMIMMIVEAAISYFVGNGGEAHMQLFEEIKGQLQKNAANFQDGLVMDTSLVLDYSDEDDSDPTNVV